MPRRLAWRRAHHASLKDGKSKHVVFPANSRKKFPRGLRDHRLMRTNKSTKQTAHRWVGGCTEQIKKLRYFQRDGGAAGF
jgi:hypothetical protein